MDGLLGLVALVILVAGILGLFSPRIIGADSRWRAGGLMFLWLVPIAISMILSDKPDEPAAGWAGFLLFAPPALLAFVMDRRAKRSEPVTTERTVAEKIAEERAFHARLAAQAQGQPAPDVDLVGQMHRERSMLQSEVSSLRRQLDEALGRGQISPAPRRPAKPKINADPNMPSANKGKMVMFTYVDADGEVTDREVSRWTISGAYLNGFCLERRATRKFRLDRVIEWQSWD